MAPSPLQLVCALDKRLARRNHQRPPTPHLSVDQICNPFSDLPFLPPSANTIMEPPSPESETSQSGTARQVETQIDQDQKETHSSDVEQSDNSKGKRGIEVEAEGYQTPTSSVLQDKSSNTSRFPQRGHTYTVVRVGGGKPIVIQDDPSEEPHSESGSDPASDTSPKPHKIKSEDEEGYFAPGGLESDDDSGTFRSTFTNESFGFSIGAPGWKKAPR